MPVARLDDLIPPWARPLHFLKIDTQGWELKVLGGATQLLGAREVRYVLYELSPWLMRRANTGDALELVRLLPERFGATCFDMMGEHSDLSRPSAPLAAYLESLDGGRHGYVRKAGNNAFGPWDDVMCALPRHGARV